MSDKKKILIVEDDEGVSRALMIRLKSAGYDVAVAHDGLSGMSTAVREIPDLAILDLSMPAGNGFELADRMRSRPETAGIPFIILTASKKEGLRKQAKELGASSFLEKPYHSPELLDAVGKALELPLNRVS